MQRFKITRANIIGGLSFFLSVIASFFGCAQQPPESRPAILNPEFDQKIARMISFSVPVVGVKELNEDYQSFVLLDAREQSEYNVSHLPGAIHIGYDHFDLQKLKDIPKDTPLVIYCSIGYRSEKIGEKLNKEGFSNVQNLYGSIFEWVNQGYPIVNNQNQPTQEIHTYNQKWSRWMNNPSFEKKW